MNDPVVIIACTGPKSDTPAPAADLYQGQTFGLALSAALAEVDHDAERVLILSARYGLIRLSTVVEPYDVTIGDEDAIDANTVSAQALALGLADHTEVYAMVPNSYLGLLDEALRPIGTYAQPVFEGARGIGDQRHVMSRSANEGIDR